MMSDKLFRYLGKGWEYPFRFENGNIAKAEGLDSIKSSIYLILETKPGEIFMMPHIGCRLWELVFMSIDDVFFALAEEYIVTALYEQEPRITNIRVQFVTMDEEPNRVDIVIYFDVIRTGVSDSIVYTFYAQGGEAE